MQPYMYIKVNKNTPITNLQENVIFKFWSCNANIPVLALRYALH